MALYNNLTAADIKNQARSIADDVERNMIRWKYFADGLNTISSADMTALGLDSDYQAWLGSLRVALLNIELMYRKQAPLNADDPSYMVKRFASLIVM